MSKPLPFVVVEAVRQRLLDREMPDLAELRDAIDAIIGNGRRASEIIRRVCAFSRKADPEMSPLDIA